jgi:16S rRNA (cytidine1402-2'-O)-methyltransferase
MLRLLYLILKDLSMKLYVIATPIGNLEDITFRAVRILASVDLILAEDTRRAKILLDRYHIKTPVRSYHQHSETEQEIIAQLKSGPSGILGTSKSIALISDAGTPGISDPGQKLIAATISTMAHKRGTICGNIKVEAVPGPAAVTAALSISGFPTDKFYFAGFLPHKKGRETYLKKLADYDRTIVLYESPYRIIKTLNDLKNHLHDREVMVARELTKKFETIYRGKISEIISQIKPKGEFVIVIKGKS